MAICKLSKLEIQASNSRKLELNFEGGNVSSDAGGTVLLRGVEKRCRLIKRAAALMVDNRQKGKNSHTQEQLLLQRVFALALGYEDLNDHDSLRNDIAFQEAIGKDVALASSPTLCRWENRMQRADAIAMHQALFEQFIAAHPKAPEEIVLDFDSTNSTIYGNQEGKWYQGHYQEDCYLPLYVFCGQHALVAYLRKANRNDRYHVKAVMKILVNNIRKYWPNVKIIVRGDNQFYCAKLLSWADRNKVGYIFAMQRNCILESKSKALVEKARSEFEKTNEAQVRFGRVQYKSGNWERPRDIIIKVVHNLLINESAKKKTQTHFVVTNVKGSPKALNGFYNERANMENRIKDQQLYLFADRTSCQRWWPNQIRLLLSAMAYCLMENVRRIGLSKSVLENARVDSIRLKLFKIGAVITRNTRRIKIFLSSACPYQEIYTQACLRLFSSA